MSRQMSGYPIKNEDIVNPSPSFRARLQRNGGALFTKKVGRLPVGGTLLERMSAAPLPLRHEPVAIQPIADPVAREAIVREMVAEITTDVPLECGPITAAVLVEAAQRTVDAALEHQQIGEVTTNIGGET